MIVFIATTQTQDLLKGEEQEQVWKYCLWREPLQKFLKEQYGKLATLKPETFVIDLKALDSPSDLPLLIQTFPAAKYLIIVPAGQKFRMQHCIPFPEGEGLLQYLKEGPQHQKIGIISNEKTDATALTAFQLISCLAEEQNNLCYIEVEKEARLPEWAEKYHLVKTDHGYEYQSIPFYSNLAKDTELAIFDFGCRDAAKEKMFQKCDIALVVEPEKGHKLRIKREDEEVVIKIPKDPFRPNHSDVFQDLIPEIDFGVTEKKPKKIKREKPKKQKKQKQEKVKKEKTIKKMPVFRKKNVQKQETEKSKKKVEWELPNLEKFKMMMTKRRLLILVLILAVISVSAASIRIYSAQKKEETVKEAVQKKQKGQHPETTVESSTEKPTAQSTREKKKSTKWSKGTTETSVSKVSSTHRTTIRTTIRTTRQTSSKRPAAITRGKKPAATTRKKKPRTTRKPKPTTTERFDINYGPE